MLHAASKLLWFLAQPSTLIVLAILAGIIMASVASKARAGRRLAVGGLCALFVAGLTPLASFLLMPLEARFPKLTLTRGQQGFTGIIVLGGAEDGRLSVLTGQLHLNEAAERIVEGARLALRLPDTRLVFTGGVASILSREPPGAEAVAAAWREMGIPSGRIVLEDRSRNTYENAVFTRDLVAPKPGERWLLVTSAAHMPRAVGTFRGVGFDVVAYPVDWRTSGLDEALQPFGSLPAGLRRLDDATKEWTGLASYWLMGRSSALFPGP